MPSSRSEEPLQVFLVGGARPNYVKVAPLYHAFVRSGNFEVKIVDTGQHYDRSLARGISQELGLPEPDIALHVGSGTHASQTARILERFEAQLLEHTPDLVVVVGDVNSTMACTLAASKIHFDDGRRPRVAHVEAGLRSFDRTMPEEINRILTDAMADYLFATEQAAVDNLLSEGHTRGVFLVGNVMIDSLLGQAEAAAGRRAWEPFGLSRGAYAVATLHRPSNVDSDVRLRSLIEALRATGRRLPVVFPVHPRTRARLESMGVEADPALIFCEPQPYVDFLSLMTGARLVLTDSGGIQEETTILGVPCLTLRENTERPVTVSMGTNRLIGTDCSAIIAAVEGVLSARRPHAIRPPLWDGAAASRIVEIIETQLSGQTWADDSRPLKGIPLGVAAASPMPARPAAKAPK
jgi:UDP-N-acetylglucosamine 2-epimerase (non-hydrolysing)